MNSPYWAASDRSRPHLWCSAATAWSVACTPSMVRAGSPGTRWIMKNTMIVTPIATGSIWTRRRQTNPSRLTASPGPNRGARSIRSEAHELLSQASSMW